MSEPARAPSPEVDFLSALRLRGLALISLGGLLGAVAGMTAGGLLLHRHEARVVFRVATLGLMGPVVPLSEVKARLEARSQIMSVLEAHHASNPTSEVDAYKVSADPDLSRDGTVVTLSVTGPDPDLTLALAKDTTASLADFTHQAFAAAMKDHQEELAHATRTSDAFTQAAAVHPAGEELQAQTEVALEFEHWAGEVSSIRSRAQHEVLTSRDTEIIDPPYLKENNTRVILVAALGAFAGMLVALALVIRPDPPLCMSRVVLDLRMVRGTLHGIARYALELARRIPALAPEHEVIALRDARERLDLPDGVTQVPCRRPFLDPREQLELIGVLGELRPDLVHWTSFSVPALSTARCVITLHDANHLAFPEHYGPLHGLYYRSVVMPAARRAARVITVSHFAAGELELHLGLPRAGTAVVPNGVDPRFRPASGADRAAIREQLTLPKRFALYVGNTKPHKNVGVLIAAASEAGLPLVAAVPQRMAGDFPGVHWREGVTDAMLPALYSAAEVFGFPSLYEGFGLPPVEALSCGAPVVASSAASLPEVLGDAAELVDPRDVSAWAAALRRASDRRSTRAVQERRRFAARYSWDETAEQTLAIYQAVLHSAQARVS